MLTCPFTNNSCFTLTNVFIPFPLLCGDTRIHFTTNVVDYLLMRGNRLARGGDPMKTRSQKRREKKEKLSKTGRVIRLKKRLGRIAAKRFSAQTDTHTTSLMESYILRRKAERAEERKKQQALQGTHASEGDGEMSAGSESTEHESDNGEYSSCGDDSAFELDTSGLDGVIEIHGTSGSGAAKNTSRGAAPRSTKGKNNNRNPPANRFRDGRAKKKPCKGTATTFNQRTTSQPQRSKKVTTRSLY